MSIELAAWLVAALLALFGMARGVRLRLARPPITVYLVAIDALDGGSVFYGAHYDRAEAEARAAELRADVVPIRVFGSPATKG